MDPKPTTEIGPDGQVRFVQSEETKARNHARWVQAEQDAVLERERRANAQNLTAEEYRLYRLKHAKDVARCERYGAAGEVLQFTLMAAFAVLLWHLSRSYTPNPSFTPLTIFAGIAAGMIVSMIVGFIAQFIGGVVKIMGSTLGVDNYELGWGSIAAWLVGGLAVTTANCWSFAILFS